MSMTMKIDAFCQKRPFLAGTISIVAGAAVGWAAGTLVAEGIEALADAMQDAPPLGGADPYDLNSDLAAAIAAHQGR